MRIKFWYRTDVTGCPACGSEHLRIRHRVYRLWQAGVRFHYIYDYCEG